MNDGLQRKIFFHAEVGKVMIEMASVVVDYIEGKMQLHIDGKINREVIPGEVEKKLKTISRVTNVSCLPHGDATMDVIVWFHGSHKKIRREVMSVLLTLYPPEPIPSEVDYIIPGNDD